MSRFESWSRYPENEFDLNLCFQDRFGVSQREDDSEHFRKNPSIDSRRRHSGKEDCGAQKRMLCVMESMGK